MTTDYFAGDPRTNLERMLAGDLYIADDPEIGRRLERAMRLAARYQATYLDERDQAKAVLAELLGSVGEDVEIRPPLYVDYGSNITVGARTFVNYHLTALDVAAITIGEDCQIGPNVQLLTAHPPGGTGAPPRQAGGGAAHHHRGQRVDRRRRDRLPRRDHRRQHGHRRGRGRHQGHPGERRGGRQPGPPGPHPLTAARAPHAWPPDTPTPAAANGSSRRRST
ncbi:acetyltransferase-like isoleucine patch superfamily enzyme [Streptomyces albogriseolus]